MGGPASKRDWIGAGGGRAGGKRRPENEKRKPGPEIDLTNGEGFDDKKILKIVRLMICERDKIGRWNTSSTDILLCFRAEFFL